MTQPQLQQYMDYALRFYSWVDGGGSTVGAAICAASAANPECRTLRSQILRRLLEERIIARYATRHGITLTASDLHHVDTEMRRLSSPHATTRDLVSSAGISPALVRTILQNQVLVRRVERAVVGKAALSGPSFELRKYAFASDKSSYAAAVTLATAGQLPPGAEIASPKWVGSFRLSKHVRALLGMASAGNYVGPIDEKGRYVVLELLAKGIHRYGRPARDAVQARLFRRWIDAKLRHAHPECYEPASGKMACGG